MLDTRYSILDLKGFIGWAGGSSIQHRVSGDGRSFISNEQ